jgi:hypothetical protein
MGKTGHLSLRPRRVAGEVHYGIIHAGSLADRR